MARVAPQHAAPRARAFTLLETVLAVTVIATITTLAAMVWSSAASHADAAQQTAGKADLQRIVTLAQAQWQSRRVIRSTTSTAGQDEGLVAFAHDGVSFVTTKPVIFTDWPLVHATYRLVPLEDGATSLVYLETRVMDTLGNDPLVGGLGPDGRARTGGIELIANADDLRIERFGIAPLFLTDPDWVRRSRIDFVQSADATAPTSPADARVRLQNDEVVSVLIASERALYGDPNVPEQLTPRWRTYLPTDPLTDRPPAVRITGTVEGEAFACVFAARASR